MSIQELLYEEIQRELEKLKSMEEGTEEYKNTIDTIAKLTDRLIEIEKAEKESEDKQAQMIEDRKDRLVKNVLNGVGIVLPVVVTIWGTLKSFKFEQEGTITTIMGRGFINKLLPKK